jgi:O-antigen/teichoic acid export membrane protein
MLKGIRLLSTLGGNLFDQALSALSNVVLAILVARSLDATGFGSFSIAFLVYGIAFAGMKSVVGQPLQIRFSSSSPDELNRRIGDGAGTTLVMAIVLALGCALAGLGVGGTTGAALLALAVWLPSLLVQDFCRMAFFAAGRPWSAALIDAAWAVAQFALLAVLIGYGRTSLDWLIGAWGLGASVSAVIGLLMLKAVPRPGHTVPWIREQFTLSRYLLSEYVLGLGAVQVGILLVGVIASESAVGALRAAQVLLGPLGILGTAAFQFTVPEIARRTQLPARRIQAFAALVSASLLAAHVAYITVLLNLPQEWGAGMFGDSWHGAATVLLAMSLSACFSCAANGPAGVLYGLGWARETFRINVIKAPLIVILLLGATWLWGVVGSAWALATIEAVILPFWIITLIRASHQPRHAALAAQS